MHFAPLGLSNGLFLGLYRLIVVCIKKGVVNSKEVTRRLERLQVPCNTTGRNDRMKLESCAGGVHCMCKSINKSF